MSQPVRAGSDQPLPTVRWDPFREIEDAWTRMGSLLGDVVGGERRPYGVLAGRTPGLDIEETDDAFIVELELPGVRSEDLSIDLRDNELTVSGEVREREARGTLRRQGRRTGRFEHAIAVPGEVNPDTTTASLDCGVLTLRLPKAHSSQPRHISISEPTSTETT
ncbi:Hsp20/alpha crystallin family protein [Parafrankia sp. EUN1f]|uniref:Hsp20/alpha crystallin family protein n=1 Tax=Parafrankia sp. EUN1f TaxID=102897 RepID=UPI0001C43AE5|nr:Hsp20/alpha crystallin family protein [Parafrankia sp. EUN1f]EFC82634.1 heat shock protein Hsp20 [Parafrankia sp. EUN1f]